MLDSNKVKVLGFLKISDIGNGEVLEETCNAIHFGNLADSIAASLAGMANGHIRYMAFGDGGTSISANGDITYRQPDVTNVKDTSSSLYSEIYHQEIGYNGTTNLGNDPTNTVLPVKSNSQYSDIKMTATLDFSDTSPTQDAIDRSANMDGNAIIDEIALYTGEPSIGIGSTLANSNDALMISHVIFHPIQKSNNRILQIDYTIRIYLEAI